MEKIVLFGAGKRCREAIASLSKEYMIEFIVDNDKNKVGSVIEGLKVENAEILRQMLDRMIVITPVNNAEIVEQLSEMLINNIFVYGQNKDIQKVAYSVKRRKQLKAHEISVGKFMKLVSSEHSIELDNVCFKSGGSQVLDYAFLKGIMQHFNLHTYLEIGTYIGESINNVSSVAEKCFSITVPPEHPGSMKYFCQRYDMIDFSNRLTDESNIIQYLEDSKEFDFEVIQDDIDLWFIDGDHSIEGIENDTKKIMERRNKCSFIVWHDVKKENHQINEITIEAIYNAIGSEGFERFYICDNCLCGIYVPDKHCDFFDELCNYDRNVLYTYRLAIEVHEK